MTLTRGSSPLGDLSHLWSVEVHAAVHVRVLVARWWSSTVMPAAPVAPASHPGAAVRRTPARAALFRSRSTSPVDGGNLGPELEPLDGAGCHDRRRALKGEADEGNLRVAGLAHLVGREDGPVGVLEEDVRGEVLEQRAAERRAVLTAVNGMAAVATALVAVLHPAQYRRCPRRTRDCRRPSCRGPSS